MHIVEAFCDFQREPLIRPFGFKGSYMHESWQNAVLLKSDSGAEGLGLGTQSVLWSDAEIFSATSESGGNALMYAVLDRAVQMVRRQTFEDPMAMLEAIRPEIMRYAAGITGRADVRETFALNALVALDNAAWLLYASECGIDSFDDLIPQESRPALSHRHRRLASIPLMSYAIPVPEIRAAVDSGYFFMKIKIGSPGDPRTMLETDLQRVRAIHRAIGGIDTPHTRDGRIPYYFDANGRYPDKETLARLLDGLADLGITERIAILEEPFPESYEADVGDLGVRIAADESAHTDRDAVRRIDMGYGAIALKPIAKTMSMTLRIAAAAHELNVPCFCADLTVNPVLVEWNKNMAARLAPIPGLDTGLLETNGHQNYSRWQRMVAAHPCPGAAWRETKNGLFELDDDFYRRSGGIFLPLPYYRGWFTALSPAGSASGGPEKR